MAPASFPAHRRRKGRSAILQNAILGGTEIGPDVGYGPARFLTPRQVREVNLALAQISADELARRYPHALRAAGYTDGSDDDLEAAQDLFERLAMYYKDAAAQGNAMLLYIT